MRQMVALFQLKPRSWSDGRSVTASDSLYSYEMAAHPDTPADKFRFARTTSYEVVDEQTIRWIGMPGFEDRQVALNFAKPLPQHIMGTLSPAELVNAEISARRPIGDGPFKIVSWEPGERIVMTKNENYYRQAEGLPHIDQLTFLFFGQSGTLISQLLSGECDIVTHDGLDFRDAPFLLDAELREQLTTYFEVGTVYEHIDFGINSAPGYGDAIGRPDWFEDARVRQGITYCTDRQRMNNEIFFGLSEVMHTYFPESHPLFNASVDRWPYDPEAGNRLLDEAGFRDDDEDGIREAFDGTPFQVTFGTTTGNLMRQQIGQIFAENMRDCGIVVDLYYLPSEEWFASGPEGLLFGRQFDLAEFGWRVDERFSCNLFTTEQVPSATDSWDGLNVSGW
ncbi:MAG: ABC transporter substrate-binding protein, partial [Chloroflexota bacterium]